MPLYIRDAEVDDLAERLKLATKAPSKTAAVRAALERDLARVAATQNFDVRNADVLAMADRLGQGDAAFDMKKFTDEMWGD